MRVIERNSEILFIYDACMCNPNGDPDDENKPRIDYETGRNLVTDVRLKRYLRDYWLAQPEDWWQGFGYQTRQDVWVRKIEAGGEERTVSAKDRIDSIAKAFGYSSAKEGSKKAEFKDRLLDSLIDVRCFGATMPIGADEGAAGASATFTGAVQFTWGYSLNRVELLPSSTISSHFAGREAGEKGQYGTFGKDWRVKYSLLAFYGVVSSWRAKRTKFNEIDLELLDKSLPNALPLMTTTRSKIGQTPQVVLRVEYKDDTTLLGDFRSRIRLNNPDRLENIAQAEIDYKPLADWLKSNEKSIKQVYLWVNPGYEGGKDLATVLGSLPIKEPA